MTARRSLLVASGLCLLAFLAAWSATPLASGVRVGAIDLLWLGAALIAAIASFWATLRPENAHLRRSLTLFGVSALAWSGGQAIWTYQELVQDVASPMYAAADVFYLLSVVLQAAAVFAWPRDRIRWDSSRVLDMALIGGFATLFGIEFVLDPMLAMDIDGLASLYAFLYPPSEILLFGAIAAVFMLGEWHDRARLELAALGLLAICIGDAGYTYLGDAYATGGFLDPLWTIGLCGVACAAAAPADWRGRRSLIGERGLLFAPAAALVLLATTAVGLHWTDGTGVTTGELFGLLGLVVLLAVRQGHAQMRLGEHVAEQRRLEQQLQHAQKLDAVGRLAGGVAHDFNNLLTAIDGYSELALQQLADEDPVRADINEVRRAAQRASDLTRQLLAFSRRQVLTPELVELNQVVADADRMLRRLIGEHITLETVLDAQPTFVRADAGQLEQVVTNLVLNARDAMPGGGKIHLEVAVDGPRIRLRVSDTGTGMSDETKARMFEPFFTTKAVGEGTGLGLAMVHGIVTQSGGEIMVTSTPGRGTCFEVVLPAGKGLPKVSTAVAPIDAAPAVETVLLVEDEPAVRDLARRMLARAGYVVMTASCGEEALQLLGDAGPVDVLVTDLVMPGMSGHELASRLRLETPGLPVVLTSGYSQDSAALETLRAAGAAFVEKPFTSSSLVSEIQSVLDAPAR